MSIITPSDTALAYLAELTIGQQRFDISEQSDSTGHTATRLGGPPRWTAALRTLDALEPAVAALWKAIAVQLRGRVNHLALYDVAQPQPRGTARGSITLASTAAAGAVSLALAGCMPSNQLFTYHQTLDNAAWSKVGATITANGLTAPDGSATGDTLVEDTSTGGHYIARSVSVVSGNFYTLSAYVKAGVGTRYARLLLPASSFGGNKGIVVNLSTGAILSNTGGVAAASTDAGNGWWRISAGATATATTSTFPQIGSQATTSFAASHTGDGVSSIGIWGVQLEIGALTDYQGNATLLAGDMLQVSTGVGSHLCMVTANATADGSGAMTVSIEPPLRKQFTSSTAVAWDKPLGHFKQRPDAVNWSGVAGGTGAGGFAFDLIEDWSA